MGSNESVGEAGFFPVTAAVAEDGSSSSVSEPLRSSSQLSATGLDLGFCAGFCGAVGDSLRCVRVLAISGNNALSIAILSVTFVFF